MSYTVLIADDHDDNRELLCTIVVSAGYQVLQASNGVECLELVRTALPDLLLVDLSMPALDGWEVLRDVRENDSTRHVACVAVTASAHLDRERAQKIGFDDYLAKPYRSEEVLELIRKVLAERLSSKPQFKAAVQSSGQVTDS